MIIYVLMFFLCVFFAYFSQRKSVLATDEYGNQKIIPKKFFAVVSALPVIFFAGMRGEIADSTAYIKWFDNITWSKVWNDFTGKTNGKSPGYSFLNWLVHLVTDDYTVWFFIVAIVCVWMLWRTFYKYSDSFAMSVFLFFGTTSFSWLFNGMRQYITICAMILMFPMLLKTSNPKKDRINLILFVLISLALYTVHSSALVAIPIFFLCRGELFGRWKTLIILGFVAASSFVGPFTSLISETFKDPQFGTVSTDVGVYDGASIFRLMIAMIPVFLGLYRIKVIKRDNEPVFNFCFNMSIVNVCLWVPAVVISGNTFGRFAEYTNTINLILYPMMLERYYGGMTKKVLKLLIIGLFSFWFYYQVKMTWNWPYVSDILGVFQ